MKINNAMLEAVAEVVAKLEKYDVHTIVLELNGRHGEFDLAIDMTDDDLEDYHVTGIAYRNGGVDHLINPLEGKSGFSVEHEYLRHR